MANAEQLQDNSGLASKDKANPPAGRNLVVLSDGTGNSAASASKTNVWRLYQALDMTDGAQIAAFSDGVGTSSIMPVRILGQALGFGVQLHVIRLYKFLCRNYVKGDQIWAFGFSRGAFTIRVLVGLIEMEGLVNWETEADLDRNALAAYRSFRKKAFDSSLPWVKLHRYIRARWTDAWNDLAGGQSYESVTRDMEHAGRRDINVRFIGVWDTVAAYGLPVQELTDAFDKWVWPLTFKDTSLCEGVEHARQALSLDDDRRTFFPIPWDESAEKAFWAKQHEPDPPKLRPDVHPGRLKQVWFAGAHASVGGGYPDDGISFVALNWMIGEAQDKGLKFQSLVVEEFKALANPTGRIYDPRSGFGALYRYQPRDVQALLNKNGEGNNNPLVFGSVMTRIASGTEGYAPISLPETIDVLPPHGSPVALSVPAVNAALAKFRPCFKTWSEQELGEKLVLENMLKVADAASRRKDRAEIFELVKDTVWWRELNYLVSVILVSIALFFPFLPIPDIPGEAAARGPVVALIDLAAGFLPRFLDPWLMAVREHAVSAALVATALFLNLSISSVLQSRICDRARAGWNMGIRSNYLRLTGRRGGAIGFAMSLFGLAIGAWSTHLGWAKPVDFSVIAFLFATSFGFYVLWRTLCRKAKIAQQNEPQTQESRPPKSEELDPKHPGFLLGIARKMRTNGWAASAYGDVEKRLMPRIVLFLSVLATLLLLNRGAFDLASSGGLYCGGTIKDGGEEDIGPRPVFRTNAMCQPTGIRLVKGGEYRIKITTDEGVRGAWFDKDRRTDVAGFEADDVVHAVATPLKRWWGEKWFQPIARIGVAGNYEHPLKPSAPLPGSCRPENSKDQSWLEAFETIPGYIRGIPAALLHIPDQAAAEFKEAHLACENAMGHDARKTLISDITADATGELFIYVNDAVLALPNSMNVFYMNNSGGATIEVTRIEADAIIAAEKKCGAAEGSCSR
ncbi:DUF2235 domain-containing protein [Methylocapsa palsarum]|uniref:Uncharacterized alpha/beta hydrolase domain n=1 Tax=Methylocapsa palsarum TaxID=1612308 RepID=A0A1I4BQD5_9HYPH|nr:DUF2235 domain-containing protein [Methylocapsa palsarum]SFK71018.1 Uncharacterized alpha/beta hydrolase domain [Methylocapsa palsarum]